MSARGALRRFITFILIAATGPAVAASFGLSPLGLAIGVHEQSGSVLVTNTGGDEIVLQARPYAWSQSGKESRSDTRDLIMNPPIFKLAGGEQQLVRVASRTAPLSETERAYRVVFSEVPLPASSPQPGFRITVAMDIPVYIEPLKPAKASVTWRVKGFSLIGENAGGRRLRLRNVQLMDGEKVVHTLPGLVVLAHSRLDIELPETTPQARGLRLIGQDDADQPVAIDIPFVASQ
jgi:fimbrial chaperone protein